MELDKKWKRIVVDTDTEFFRNVFQQVIKHPRAQYPKDEVSITAENRQYKFKFEWQDSDICGIEVYEEVKNENNN